MDFASKNLLFSPSNLSNDYDKLACSDFLDVQTNGFQKQGLSTAVAAKPANYETTITEQNVTASSPIKEELPYRSSVMKMHKTNNSEGPNTVSPVKSENQV